MLESKEPSDIKHISVLSLIYTACVGAFFTKKKSDTHHLSVGKNRVALMTIMVVLAGCDKDIHQHPELVTGKQLFDHHCASCHTETGRGNFLKGVPPNKNSLLTVWQISHKIRTDDKDKRKMPLYPNMSIQEAEMIADYVKQL